MIYIIIQHEFDDMENHCPESEKVLGYVDKEEEAKKIVDGFNKNLWYVEHGGQWKRCESYYPSDKQLYPYLSYRKLEKYNGFKYIEMIGVNETTQKISPGWS